MLTPKAQPDLNVVSPENLLDPVPLYRRLQEEDPVHWSESMRAWFVTRHEDVTALFRDPRLTANRTQLFMEQLRHVGLELIKDQMEMTALQMINSDGAEHARRRRNANPGFTTQAMDHWRPTILRIVESLLDKVQHQGRMDLVSDLAGPFPLHVIMELFDIPHEIREDFVRWSFDVVGLFGAPVGADVKALAIKGNTAAKEFLDYMSGLVEVRRAKPGRDLLSIMIHAEEEGRLDKLELIANLNVISIAGHITTVDQLSNSVHLLLTHPEQFQQLKENPSLMKSAVEEMLRYSPAVPFMHRVVLEDIELHGRTIKRGQIVFLGMAAANRDPKVFPEPDRFDITRENSRHVSFAFGPHTCLGATLARYDLEIGLGALLERLPDLRLDTEQPARVKCHSLVFRGFDALPLRWSPKA
jgi:cytochrome P450 PksS